MHKESKSKNSFTASHGQSGAQPSLGEQGFISYLQRQTPSLQASSCLHKLSTISRYLNKCHILILSNSDGHTFHPIFCYSGIRNRRIMLFMQLLVIQTTTLVRWNGFLNVLALQKLSKTVVVCMSLPSFTHDFTYLLRTLNLQLASKILQVAGKRSCSRPRNTSVALIYQTPDL